jgi:hypothetical protein
MNSATTVTDAMERGSWSNAGTDATEYADEFVDAVDPCRNGLVDCEGRSVWARLRVLVGLALSLLMGLYQTIWVTPEGRVRQAA